MGVFLQHQLYLLKRHFSCIILPVHRTKSEQTASQSTSLAVSCRVLGTLDSSPLRGVLPKFQAHPQKEAAPSPPFQDTLSAFPFPSQEPSFCRLWTQIHGDPTNQKSEVFPQPQLDNSVVLRHYRPGVGKDVPMTSKQTRK